MKRLLYMLTSVVLVVCLSACSSDYNNYDFSGKVGNTSENAVKSGFCATDNYIYMINENYELIEIDKETRDFLELSNVEVLFGQYSVIDNYIFYNSTDGLMVSSLDGKFEKKLSDGLFSPLVAFDCYVYYSEGRDGILKRIDIKTLEEETLSEDIISEFGIFDEKLYYVMEGNLYTADLNGENTVILVSDTSMYSLTYGDGKIYFINTSQENVVCSYDLNSKETETVIDEISAYYITCLEDDTLIVLDKSSNLFISNDMNNPINSNVESFYIYENEIYYITNFNEYYFFNLATEESEPLVNFE